MSSRQIRRLPGLMVGLALLATLTWSGRDGGLAVAQTATPRLDTQTLAPEMSTSRPESKTVAPETAQATAETSSLSADDGPGISAGIIAGIAAAGAVILAGIAYRIVRGRPRTE